MKKTFTLSKPIMINGEEVKELEYDVDEITAKLYSEAEKRSGIPSETVIAGASPSFQLYLAFAAIIAVNPKIDWTDLERIKGRDIPKLSGIGLNFTLGLEENLTEEKSEKP